MTTTTVTETERALYEMLTENTGSHFLDSGGAYGRSWQRNQGSEVEDFKNAPSATYDGYSCWTINVFQWLAARLSFNAELDAEFKAYQDETGSDRYDLEDMEDFAELKAGSDWRHGYLAGTTNSYNHECALSQTIQFTMFEYESDCVVLLQIHGGCDVRGGYTRPRVFTVDGYESAYMFDFDNVTFCCTAEPDAPIQDETLFDIPVNPIERHYFDIRSGEVTDWNGEYRSDIEIEENDDRKPLCPECGGVMEIYANNDF